MSWIECDFDSDWVIYEKDKQIEKQTYALIQKSTNDVWDYFQEFGLGIQCLKEEL